MPFTFSHPAAVLPLKRWFVFSALVVGSMAPDYHYFMLVAPGAGFSHSIRGAFLFCMPVGLFVLWLFHRVMKLPLISLAPHSHQERLVRFAVPFRFGGVKRLLAILLSLFIGIVSHDVWDAFTHERGWVVRRVPDLRSSPLQEFGTDRPIYNVLQHGSTVLGLLVLAFFYWRWFKRTPSQPVPEKFRINAVKEGWIGGVGLMVVAAVSVVRGYRVSYQFEYPNLFVGASAITAMTLSFGCALAFSLWWQWKHRSSPV